MRQNKAKMVYSRKKNITFMDKILGVGCDLTDVTRIKEALYKNREGFLERILTPSEIAYCQTYKDPSTHIAARFAAKEAVSKALGVGIGQTLGWHDIIIVHNDKKKPLVQLSLKAQEHFGAVNFELSLSHLDQIACAFVIAFTKS